MAEQVIDKATIVNDALIALGQAPTFSIGAEDAKAAKIASAWRKCVGVCFPLHDWTFARQTYRLTRLAATPDNGWSFAFTLPGNRIGEPLKILEDPRRDVPLRDFSIEAGKLYADVDTAFARCKVELDPVAWDIGFRAAFTVALTGYLAVPMQHDEDLATAMLRDAFGTPSQQMTGGMFGRLMAQNVAADPPDAPNRWNDPLSAARFS